MNFETIARLRKYITIKKSAPGRINIKFSLGILTDKEALKLANSPLDMPAAVLDAKVKMFSRTMQIDYDAAQVDKNVLEELVTTNSDIRAAEIVQHLHSSLY